MIYTQPENVNGLPYSTVKINGCSDTNVEFTLLTEQPTVGKRRYCNKVLVHECVSVPEASPLDLSKAEFLATSDNCYRVFEFYKSNEDIDVDNPATISFVTNVDGDVTSILIQFSADETCCLPLRLAYRLYGYLNPDNDKLLLSQGVLYVSPCECTSGETKSLWTQLNW